MVKQKRTIAGLTVTELPGDPEGPTILMLHGFGANGMNLFPLSTLYSRSPKPTWLFPDGPLKIVFFPSYTGHAWFPIRLSTENPEADHSVLDAVAPESIADARKQVEQLITELAIPRAKLILGGFSQGAVLAADTILHGTEPVAALLFLSGTLVCESLWKARAPLHAHTPFFQSHGSYDTLLPIGRAKAVTTLLKEAGWQGDLFRFSGGHELSQEVLASLRDFLHHLL